MTSRSDNSTKGQATESMFGDRPLSTGRSDATLASVATSKPGDVQEPSTGMSELAALCSDDIPSSETRRDPGTGKVWTYSAYRSAHIADLDFLSIRNHWLKNCTLVAASEVPTQEIVESWLPFPCMAEDCHVTNAEPEEEAEGTQETPQKRVVEEETFADATPEISKAEISKAAKVCSLPDDFIAWTNAQSKKYHIDAANDVSGVLRSPSPSRSPSNRRQPRQQ